MNDFMPAALAAVLRNAPMTDDKLAFAWRQAVGPGVDRVTSVRLDGTTLCVRTQGAQWRREIQRSLGLIRSRLDMLLGAGVIRNIDLTESSPASR